LFNIDFTNHSFPSPRERIEHSMQSIVSVLGEGSICIEDLINLSSPNRQVRRGSAFEATSPKEVLND
jgi:hypothetical protein